jgi:GTP-binding protein HflX
MSKELLYGDLSKISTSTIKRLNKLTQRRIDSDQLAPFELVKELYSLSEELGRILALLISRDGNIEQLVVGSKRIVYLPDLGRYRLAAGRLRNLRLITTDLSSAERDAYLTEDLLTDLEKLRFDCVAAVKARGENSDKSGKPSRISLAYAHLVPTKHAQDNRNNHDRPIEIAKIADLRHFSLDYKNWIEQIEVDLERNEWRQSKKGGTLSSKTLEKNQAILVSVSDRSQKEMDSSISELRELARTAGIKVLDAITQRRTPHPQTVIGKGKLEELTLHALRLGGEMLIFDQELKPTQWRSVTNAVEMKVIDRSMLILDIFAQHAKSADGRLQVELAQLKYNLPRLVEKDSGLSRLSGGIGGRGPGETKLEVSRRRSRDRIAQLEREIENLREQREHRRRRRREIPVPVVTIVGYTNVGKSTLFNALSKSQVLVENKLFATLEPAQRRISLAGESGVTFFLLSDTVGFIRELPNELVNAFRATLEELNEASLLIHVLDASDEELEREKNSVDKVLKDLGHESLETILVFNKIDLIPRSRLDHLKQEYREALFVSANCREGVSQLLFKIGEQVSSLRSL